jgi:hypothetical protein
MAQLDAVGLMTRGRRETGSDARRHGCHESETHRHAGEVVSQVRSFVAVATLLVLLGNVGCGSAPTGPSAPVDVSGRWGGTTCPEALRSQCIFEMTIAQAGSSISGTVNYVFPSDRETGTLTGTVEGSYMTFSVIWTRPESCPWLIKAYGTGSQWTATRTTSCPETFTSPITLGKSFR